MFQELINKIKQWSYRDEAARFDKEYAELIKGEQFQDEEKISQQLDFAIKTFNGKKISTDFSDYHNNIEISGIDASED